MSNKQRTLRILGWLLPVSAAPIFFAVLSGTPPLWAAWLIAIILWATYFGLGGKFKRTPFDIAIAIFIIGCITGFLLSSEKSVSVPFLYTAAACILIYYGLVLNTDSPTGYWKTTAGAAGILILGLSVWYFSQGDARHLWFNEWFFKMTAAIPKTVGPVLQVNNIGMLLAIILPLPAAVVLYTVKKRLRWAATLICLLLLLLLFLTASGSGWLAAICGLIFVLAVFRLWTLWITLPAMAAGAGIIALNLLRWSWPPSVFSTVSLTGRIDIWLKTLTLMKESPFAGLGPGMWSILYERQYGSYYVNAHNSYVQLYADTGIPGIIAAAAALAALVLVFRRLKTGKQNAWYGITIGVIGGITAGAMGSVFEVVTTGAYRTTQYLYISIPLIWIWGAMLAVASIKNNTNTTNIK